MAGVQSYVQKVDMRLASSPPAPLNQQLHDSRRLLTKGIKFSTKKAINSAAASPRVASITPASGHESKSTSAWSSYSNNVYQEQQYSVHPSKPDDTMISSDFDVTRSDVQEDCLVGDGDFHEDDVEFLPDQKPGDFPNPSQSFPAYPQHQLNYKQSQSPIRMKPEISEPYGSRFQNSQHHASLNLEHRPADFNLVASQNSHASKKRQRSDEHNGKTPFHIHQHLSDHNVEPECLPDGQGLADDDSPSTFNAVSDGAGSTTPAQSPSRPSKPRAMQQHQNSQLDTSNCPHYDFPDYDDATLKGMTYAQLKDQTWEAFPPDPEFQLPEALAGQDITLEQKIQHFVHLQMDQAAKCKEQFSFFQQISISQWDEAGDFFVEKITQILNGLREIRRQKRHLTEEFESEIEAREKSVRNRSDRFEEQFKDMKANAQTVLSGKMV